MPKLQSPVTVAQGGTGATTAANARANLAVPGLATASGYPGLTASDGTSSNWIRTTASGFLPFSTAGDSSLGTSSWQFKTIYGKTLYEGGKALSDKYVLKTNVVSVAQGGTGATTPAKALANLGITYGTDEAPSTGTPGSIYIQISDS